MRECVIIAIGQKHDPDIASLISKYEKRIRGAYRISWLLLPYSKEEGMVARRHESSAIAAKLKDDDFVVLLDERGIELTSESFSSKLDTWTSSNKRSVFIIGGAYGVDDNLRDRANFTFSLSPLVFPHQLVRLILIEQIYRAYAISIGHPYHH